MSHQIRRNSNSVSSSPTHPQAKVNILINNKGNSNFISTHQSSPAVEPTIGQAFLTGSAYKIVCEQSGISIEIEVASRCEQISRLYQKGAVSPLFQGREGAWTHCAPENCEISSPKMRFSAFCGPNLRMKEWVFH